MDLCGGGEARAAPPRHGPALGGGVHLVESWGRDGGGDLACVGSLTSITGISCAAALPPQVGRTGKSCERYRERRDLASLDPRDTQRRRPRLRRPFSTGRRHL